MHTHFRNTESFGPLSAPCQLFEIHETNGPFTNTSRHVNKQWQIWQILSSKHISHMRDTQWRMKSHWVVPLSPFLLLSHLRLGNHGYHTSHTRPSISWLLLLWTHLTFELFFFTSMTLVRMIMSHPAPSPHLLLWTPVCLPYITHPLKSQVVCSQSQQRQNSEICRKEERWYIFPHFVQAHIPM